VARRVAILLAAMLGGCGAEAGNVGTNRQGGDPPMNRQDGDPPAAPAPRASGPCEGPIMQDMLDDCDFGPAERLSGVWVTGFERSEFALGGRGGIAPGELPPPRPWLAFAPGVHPDSALRAELDKMRTTAAVEIVFDGRRARPPGEVVVVDRIISMRILGPVPPGSR
jgi:hypothetical protein